MKPPLQGLPPMIAGKRLPRTFPRTSLSTPAVDLPEPLVLYEHPPSNPNGKKVVITGGAGFLGSQLGWHLHQSGYDVTLIDNMMFGYEDNLYVPDVNGTAKKQAARASGHGGHGAAAKHEYFGRFVFGDVLDPRVWKFLDGADCVFHFAALSALPVCQANPRDAMNINVGAVANILEGARRGGVRRFIFASTSAVYESNTEDVLTEDLNVNPHLLYSLSKRQAELLVRGMATTNALDAVILRFFNVYGPHQDFRRASPPFTSYLIRELVHGRRPVLHSDGKQQRDYVHVDDLIRLAELVMTSPKARGETFNVASGTPVSVNDIYHIVSAALNRTDLQPVYRDAGRFWDGYPELFAGRSPIRKSILEKEVLKRTVGSYAKAERLLGWKPQVTMQAGLQEMVRYVLRSHRMDSDTADAEKTAW
jgi:nucleoside-diphosphate-sugar epimerase